MPRSKLFVDVLEAPAPTRLIEARPMLDSMIGVEEFTRDGRVDVSAGLGNVNQQRCACKVRVSRYRSRYVSQPLPLTLNTRLP